MNSRKPSHDSLRLFRLFRTGSAPGDSVCFPMRWSPLPRRFFTRLFLSPTGPPETPQDVQAYTIPCYCTQRRRPAMCRRRADPGAAHPDPGHSECPSHPKSGDHAPARSRSARPFSALSTPSFTPPSFRFPNPVHAQTPVHYSLPGSSPLPVHGQQSAYPEGQ